MGAAPFRLDPANEGLTFGSSPHDAAARLSLQHMAGQIAINKQAQRENELTIQAKQRGIDADKALADALSTSTTKDDTGKFNIDYDAALSKLNQHGFGKEALTLDTDRRNQMTAAASALKAKLDAQSVAGEQFAGIIDTVPKVDWTKSDPTEIAAFQAAVLNAAREAKAKNLIDDSHVTQLIQGAQNPTPDFEQLIRQQGQMGIKHSEQMTDARNKVNDLVENKLRGAQTDTAVAALPSVKAKAAEDAAKQVAQDVSSITNQKQLDDYRSAHPEVKDLPLLYNPAAMTRFQRKAVPVEKQPEYDIQTKTAEQMAAMKPEDWGAQADAVAGGNQKLADRTKILVASAVSRGDFKAAQAAIKDAADQAGRIEVAKTEAQNRQIIINQGIATGPDGEPSALAKQVANYQIPSSQAMSRMSPQAREELMKQVAKLNPDFQASNFDTFKSTERAFTSGVPATKTNALNTMMGHLSVLDQAASALDNTDIVALNKLANFIGVQTGQTPVTTYNAIVHRLGPEITTAYVASGGTQGERGTNEGDFDAALGGKQIKANIGVSAQLADSKIKALQDQYTRGTYKRGTQKLISDEAEQARQRLAKQSPVNTSKAPPLPVALSASDVGKTYTSKDGNAIKVTAVNPANPKQFKFDEVK